MTNQERQLLKGTAENLVRLLNKLDDTIGGTSVAVAELYRSGMTTPERKAFPVGRLKLQLDLMKQSDKEVKFLDDLEKWAGY